MWLEGQEVSLHTLEGCDKHPDLVVGRSYKILVTSIGETSTMVKIKLGGDGWWVPSEALLSPDSLKIAWTLKIGKQKVRKGSL